MKILDKTIRECCEPRDLKRMEGYKKYTLEMFFCKYCGRRWIQQRKSDIAGGTTIDLDPEGDWPITEFPKTE